MADTVSDILVIGGGIAGISAAAALSDLGSVTVLEREGALAMHASGRSAALFEATYGRPATVALNRASRDWHATAHDGFLSDRGMMVVAGPDDAEAFDRDVAAMSLNRVSAAEARDLFDILDTDACDRFAHHAGAWDIDTDREIQCLARELRGNGGTILTGCEVVAIDRDGGWQVTTDSRRHSARILVNAAGAWADGIAVMAGVSPLGLVPFRRSMGRIPAPGGHDVARWPMVFGAGEAWYCKPDAGALIVSPADEDAVEPHDAWADDMVLAEGLARYEACVTEPVTRLLTSWAGLRTFAPDRHLVLGRDFGDPDFVWCAGQGGYGFQTAPAAARLIADLVAGRPPLLDADIVAALDPARFST